MSLGKYVVGSILYVTLFTWGSISVQAQVLVHKEPLHHLVFENSKIRILDVIMAPGDTSIFHIHHTPSLFLFFTSTRTGSMLKGQPATIGETTAGKMLYENLTAPNTRIHRVWNADKDTFQVMDIELLSLDSGFVQPPLSLPHLHKEIDTAWTRAYSLRLDRGQQFKIKEKNRSFVLVSFEKAAVITQLDGKPNSQTVVRGGFFDIQRGRSFSIQNSGDRTYEFALLELPGK